MFHIALYEPQIAPNTGNIIRLVANNGCTLHLIEPLGFDFEEKKLRRAGLDYHDLASVSRHKNYQDFLAAVPGKRIFACTTKGSRPYDQPSYQPGDVLLFGSETSGLPDEIRNGFEPDFRIRIPMQSNNRSLNLSNAVAIISYEAWRQNGFGGCL
ncbi:tRNA (cytidine(34)-2'-O)-methyltransferase [Pectobacterium sp. A5351]|uniref:tRNA (cytidine(34)-2'-O)-methyltransferase n=1 Tax=Pectobacterium sp. A5351 TaxID=2914983 RepID=UPI00232C56CB|nr:tRNA (cytidine(34)-2'-O)-methyltransferase [Pectobacterium sp. A5351]WCG83268.1 tRNA (cytidine(34)-2'-O)-methyltransferase [Pectobacterium sp. A5351]